MSAEILSFFGQTTGVAEFLLKFSLLLVVAWGLHLMFGAAMPQWRVLLWRTIGCAAILLALMVRFDVVPDITIALEMAAEDPILRHQETVQHRGAILHSTSPAAAGGPANYNVQELTAQLPIPPSRIDWRLVLLSMWFLGVVVGLSRLIAGFREIRRLLLHTAPVPAAVDACALRIAGQLMLRRVPRICISDQIQSPVLVWFGRPVLLLSGQFCEAASPSTLKAVLGHELAHLKSRDLMWNGLLRILGLLVWFHPLMWRVGRVHVEACEHMADYNSAKMLNDMKGYQSVVAELALLANAHSSRIGLAFALKSDVRQRLERLPKTLRQLPVRRRWMVGLFPVAVVAILGIAGCVLMPKEYYSGTVLLPGGSPAANVDVYLATHGHDVTFWEGKVRSDKGQFQTRTDALGSFKIRAVDQRFKLVLVHEQGTLTLTRREWESGLPLHLRAWGRVEGVMTIGGEPAVEQRVSLSSLPQMKSSRIDYVDVEWYWYKKGRTDADGRFYFEQVAPGPYNCSRVNADNYHTMPATALRVEAGTPTQLALVADGITVEGQIDWSDLSVPFRKDAFRAQEVYSIWSPDITMEPDDQAEAMYQFWHSNEGIELAKRNMNKHMASCDAEDRFSMQNVQPGTYRLSVFAYPPDASGSNKFEQLGGASLIFEVKEGGGPLDLGTLQVVANRTSHVATGETMPDLRFKLSEDATPASVGDFSGTPMLLSYSAGFWNPEFLSKDLGEQSRIQVLQLKERSFDSLPPAPMNSTDPRFLDAYVEHGGMETKYQLGLGGLAEPLAFLLNDKGTVLVQSSGLRELWNYVAGDDEIPGSSKDTRFRYFANTEFCIIKEAGGEAGSLMMMQEGPGMNQLTLSNGVNGKRYVMKVHSTGSRGLKDIYDIEMIYPSGGETVSIEYGGQKTVLFDDGVRKMILRPKRGRDE